MRHPLGLVGAGWLLTEARYLVGDVDERCGIFQIDANLGTPTAMIEMLLYSRPDHLEPLPEDFAP